MNNGVKLDRDKQVWINYKENNNHDIAYLKNSNVNIGASNHACFFGNIPYLNQIGYENAGVTIGAGNRFLSLFSNETIIGDSNTSCNFFGQTHTVGNGNIYLSIFGQGDVVGDGNMPLFVCGQSNTIGDANIASFISGQSNIISNGNIVSFISGQSNTIANSNLLLSVFGETHTIGNGNTRLFIDGTGNTFGQSNSSCFVTGINNTIGNACTGLRVIGGANTVGAAGTVVGTSIFGDGNTISVSANFNKIIGDGNTINQSSLNNTIIGQSNKIDNASNYNIIIGFGNDFVTNDVDSIDYNHILSHGCVFNNGIDGTFQYNFITGRTHSFLSSNIQENFVAGNSHLITGGNGAKYNAIFGLQNYIYSSGGPSVGHLNLVTGKYAKANKYACHVNSGGHPSLATVIADDMYEDCGAGQNVGMIPHSGKTQSSGFRPIYMNGAVNGEVYTIEENKVTVLVTYVVAAADAGARTKGWRIETLINRPLGGNAAIVASAVTVIGSTGLGEESLWDVRNTVTGGNIYLEVNAGSALPVMWQAYGLGPEVISTEDYLS